MANVHKICIAGTLNQVEGTEDLTQLDEIQGWLNDNQEIAPLEGEAGYDDWAYFPDLSKYVVLEFDENGNHVHAGGDAE